VSARRHARTKYGDARGANSPRLTFQIRARPARCTRRGRLASF
jgi:hypothetical protein